MTRRVVRTKTERTLALVARYKAWSGSLTAASLVTPLSGRSRWGERTLSVAPSGDTPTLQCWRGCDDYTPEERETGGKDRRGAATSAGGAVPAKPERWGHRRGSHQPFRGRAHRPRGAAGARVRRLHGGPVSPGGVAGRVRRGDRGHGVHRGVLDTPVRRAGRTGLPGDAGSP